MPQYRDYLPASSVIGNDRAVLRALQDLAGYTPHDPAHAIPALMEREAALQQAELESERARLAFDAARARQIVLAWAFHDDILGAKHEVIGQFGADSQAVHAIGLKKKSERKRAPRRRAAAAD